METTLFNRLQAILLAVVTAGLVLLAGLNFWQERHAQQPDDGIWWREAANGGGLVADKVLANSPGQRAGIEAGDLLTGVEVPPVGSGLRVGIQPNELLPGVKGLEGETEQSSNNEQPALSADVKFTPIVRAADLERALYRTGSYFQIYYRISRNGASPGRPDEAGTWILKKWSGASCRC